MHLSTSTFQLIGLVVGILLILSLSLIIAVAKTDSKKVEYILLRDKVSINGPCYAQLFGLIVGIVLCLTLGCNSMLVHCMQMDSGIPIVSGGCMDTDILRGANLDMNINVDVTTDYSSLESQAQTLSKLTGEKYIIVDVEGYGKMVYNPSSSNSFYALDTNGCLRPHFYLCDSYIDEHGDVHRRPTGNQNNNYEVQPRNTLPFLKSCSNYFHSWFVGEPLDFSPLAPDPSYNPCDSYSMTEKDKLLEGSVQARDFCRFSTEDQESYRAELNPNERLIYDEYIEDYKTDHPEWMAQPTLKYNPATISKFTPLPVVENCESIENLVDSKEEMC